jgi:hypothetical protein
MKLPLLAVLLFVPCVALAQTSTNSTDNPSAPTCTGHHKHKQGHSPEQELAFLTKKLDLSDSQQQDIGPILTSAATQRKAIFENASLSKEEKHQQLKALHEQTTTQIEAQLTPDQTTTFEEMQQKHHQK